MSRRSLVPPGLETRPFTLDQALASGLSRHHLAGRAWTRLAPGIYQRAGAAAAPLQRLEASAQRLPPEAAFSGPTAAWLLGFSAELRPPIDVTLPRGSVVSARVGLLVHRAPLEAADVATVNGLRVTTPVRTIADLARTKPLVEAVIAADAALHQACVSVAELWQWAAGHTGAKGVARLRRVIDLAEPRTESPMETRFRLVLVLGGLPRPAAQVRLHDQRGRIVGRADFYYPAERLALEYDGGTHRESLVGDDRRQNLLLAAGYRLLRFTAPDVFDTPAATVAQVRAALRDAARSVA